MKIGILTLHHLINYGAVYQAYALKKRLESMGHEVCVIHYLPERITKRFSTRNMIHDLRTAFIFSILHGRRKRREQFFEAFVASHLNPTRPYFTSRQLRDDPPKVDAVIVGSDQVWNPRIVGDDAAFFLDWVPSGIRKIAYAPSIASTDIPSGTLSLLQENIKRFDSLSVREESAARIIAEHCKRSASVVLDPTLISEREWWNCLMEPYPMGKPYSLSYILQKTPLIFDAVEKYAACSEAPVVNVFGELFRWKGVAENRYDITPQAFLSVLNNADGVVTNSFHATIFALLFNTPVLSVVDSNEGSRVLQLAKDLGLTDRLLAAPRDRATLKECVIAETADIFSVLADKRDFSLRFLSEALQ